VLNQSTKTNLYSAMCCNLQANQRCEMAGTSGVSSIKQFRLTYEQKY